MGFMTKEEIVKMKKSTQILDTGTTKRTCFTCRFLYDGFDQFILALHKTESKGCSIWHPGMITCGTCKHSITENDKSIRLVCINENSVSSGKEVKNLYIGCDYFELPTELERAS